MALIGVMQGRLLPPREGRVQAFPFDGWQREFETAAALGLDTVEWLFDDERYQANPIWTAEGRRAIRRCVAESGVPVYSVCGDYFMRHGLIEPDPTRSAATATVLITLIEYAAELGVRRILLPLLEDVAVRGEADKSCIATVLEQALPYAEQAGIILGLETEMPADELVELVDRFGSDHVGVYYDLGNAAALEYDLVREIALFGPRVCAVHVKDRLRGGPSVPLGTGDTDLPGAVRALRQGGFDGLYILQGSRQTAGAEAETVAAYLALMRGLLSERVPAAKSRELSV